MTQTAGSISIHAENIMPIIKRWLYSDKDIFIRELVSNGVDAVTKYKIAAPDTQDDFRVQINIKKEKGMLSFWDNGIGMTGEEVEKYINQVAFSGAEEFLKNYQSEGQENSGIIGHFGLGFYSAFMVCAKVRIDSLSFKEGALPVSWESEDGMAFTMSGSDRAERGTTVTLTLNEEDKEFLETYRVREVLNRYCGYLAVPVFLFDENEKPYEEKDKDGNVTNVREPEARQINDTHPLWLKNPKDCQDDEYREFYKKMFHEYEDPLFWVHLNVDYPFNLKGILYFPKLKQDFGAREGEVKLFAGQVFVADNIKEIIPEFLLLLKGVIDCPDLPLNVSRSFLQNDGYVKKISAHITKKVSDRLTGLFNTDRPAYESYWDDIAPFIKFGCIRDTKFFENVRPVLLLKSTDDAFYTFDEYKARNEGKVEKKIYYTTDKKRQADSVALYTSQGIDVAQLDTLIDLNFISYMEYEKGEKNHEFVRVDADLTGLSEESDEGKDLDENQIADLFKKALDMNDLEIKLQALSNDSVTAMLTEDEQSRRFKEMSRAYGQDLKMPDKYTLVLNRKSPTLRAIAARGEDETSSLLIKQLYDLAKISSAPLEADELTQFLERSRKLVEILANQA
jgi:molecular chaperone HtpG